MAKSNCTLALILGIGKVPFWSTLSILITVIMCALSVEPITFAINPIEDVVSDHDFEITILPSILKRNSWVYWK